MTADARSAAGRARSIAALHEANARRTVAAGRYSRDVAQTALDSWQPGWPQAWMQIAEAILANPGCTWAQLAAETGMTRSQATSSYRRMRIEVTGQ